MSGRTHRQPLCGLIVEDSDDDYLLIEAALRQGGFEPECRQVMTATHLEAALVERTWDFVICDHNLPAFDSQMAMSLARRLQPELPFIIVSGACSDQMTVEAIAAGAVDVVDKHKLAKLGPVLRRELSERRMRHELVASHQHLERLAYYDPLTGLPNEHRFLGELERLCTGGATFALVLADMSRFQQIVRCLGPRAGSRLAVQLAERLRAEVGQDGFLAQIGRNRFALALRGIPGAAALRAWIERFSASLPGSIVVEGATVPLAWHLGACLYPLHGRSVAQLHRHAEVAVRRALQQQTDWELFDTAWLNPAAEPYDLEDALRQALRNQEFSLDYQPQFDLQSGACIGAEALLRWRHPRCGQVSPARFVPLLEETGLIVPVGEWVLRSACRQAAHWHDQGHSGMRVAVNLAMIQFEEASLVRMVSAALADSGLPPNALELEITESVAMNDQERVMATLHELRGLGVSLAIDDFGTGYSSLAYLKNFPVDKVKIDQSFVRGIDRDPRDRAIVQAIIGMARALDLVTVAEGVESAAHLEFLHKHGCRHGQGYHLGRPLPPEQLEFKH